MSNILCGRLL